MEKIKIIHVDDDPAELALFTSLIQQFEGAEKIGSFSQPEEALAFLKEHQVDLAFLDIEMKKKDGFWLANKMMDLPTKIIFLTSHTEYALQAFEACAINYILKPLTPASLEAACDRYRKLIASGPVPEREKGNDAERLTELLDNYLNNHSYPKRLYISNIHRISVLRTEDILYISSNGAYCEFKMSDGGKFVASKNLKIYAEVLKNHPDFIRVHRSYIINKRHLKAILREKYYMHALMADEAKIEISPLRREEIYQQLMT